METEAQDYLHLQAFKFQFHYLLLSKILSNVFQSRI